MSLVGVLFSLVIRIFDNCLLFVLHLCLLMVVTVNVLKIIQNEFIVPQGKQSHIPCEGCIKNLDNSWLDISFDTYPIVSVSELVYVQVLVIALTRYYVAGELP